MPNSPDDLPDFHPIRSPLILLDVNTTSRLRVFMHPTFSSENCGGRW